MASVRLECLAMDRDEEEQEGEQEDEEDPVKRELPSSPLNFAPNSNR